MLVRIRVGIVREGSAEGNSLQWLLTVHGSGKGGVAPNKVKRQDYS